MSTEAGPSEAEMRAYEEELSRITSSQLLLQASASLLNLGGRRLGLAEGSEPERDLEQVCDAIDAIKALLPILERRMPPQQIRPLRDALSQLQMAYARLAAPSPGGAAPGPGGVAPSPGDDSQPARQRPGAQAGEPVERGGGQRPGAPAARPAEGGGQQPAEGGQQPPRNGEASRDPGPAERSGRLWIPGR